MCVCVCVCVCVRERIGEVCNDYFPKLYLCAVLQNFVVLGPVPLSPISSLNGDIFVDMKIGNLKWFNVFIQYSDI